LGALAAILAVAHYPGTAGAAPAAHATPAGLQYDEILRVVVAPATAPPPGAFHADYQQALADAGKMPAEPPPSKHRGLGAIVSAISNAGQEVKRAGAEVASFANGHLTRVAYYKGWMRTDDIGAQTATIDKCDAHQVIELNLARKTYRIEDTNPTEAAPCDTPAPAGPQHAQVENEAPGTANLTVSAKSTSLGRATLDGIATTGSNSVTEMAMTNATGSCTNGDFKVETTRYVSTIRQPRRFCPLPKVRGVASTPVDVVVRGGCKPAMHGVAGTGAYGSLGSNDRIDMYLKMAMIAGTPQAQGGYVSVMQRGNVTWLTRDASEKLFSIPAGFTKE
jgi:hypothetical protein